jgi:hypothetical protein
VHAVIRASSPSSRAICACSDRRAASASSGRVRSTTGMQRAYRESARLPSPILGFVPRNDPSDTGGLFVGRRPGTGPLHYREAPERGGEGRRRGDAALAACVLVLEALLCLSVWGPQPAAWLWVGSQVDYWTGSVFLGIVVAFFGVMATLFITLSLCARLDRVWRLLRRAAGHEQREGVLGRIFAVSAIVALIVFGFWFLVIQGPGPQLAPR